MNAKRTSEQSIYHYTNESGTLKLYGINDHIIRCVYTKNPDDDCQSTSGIIDQQAAGLSHPLTVCEEDSSIHIICGDLALITDRQSDFFTWKRTGSSSSLLTEKARELYATPVTKYTTAGEMPVIDRVKTVDGERSFIKNLKPYIDRTAYRAKLHFSWDADECIYGLGQGEEGLLNYRGHNQYLYQHNMRIPMPVIISSKGYGILIDCAGLMTFNDDHNGSYIFMDTVDRLDYYMILGPDLDQIISGIRTLTGQASMLPKWAFGYIQSKEAYQTADELLAVVSEYRKRNIPLDCVVQDWNTWPAGKWGDKNVDPVRYGNLPEVMDKIHDMHVHSMVSVWPNMAQGGSNHAEFAQNNYLLGDYSTYDAFNENARKLYWKQCKEGLFDKGFDSWWCDSTEPFSGPDWGGAAKREPWERFTLVGEEHKKYLDPAKANAFALVHAKGIFENQKAADSSKRVLNLTRSGYISQQKYGVMLWSGDISATWDVMKKQIAEGLNICMSGMPYWTLDIGGFFTVGTAWQNRGCGNHTNPNPLWFWKGDYNEGVRDLGYRELYIRWFQFGTFLPMHRSHGTDTPREIWNFGEPGTIFYDTIEKYIKLRYALMPYIYSMAGWVTQSHYTMLRSLMFDFAADKNVRNIADQYMFGPSFLVCPVTEPMYYVAESVPLERERTWTCYLPEGADWYHYWTKHKYKGGQSVTVNAPLDEMPLFVKAGSIIPQSPGLQYANQQLEEPVIIEIYSGADAQFTLYNDSGDGFGYENGEFSEIDLQWNQTESTLNISSIRGSYPGMPAECRFKIIVDQKEITEVIYDGSIVTLNC